MVSLMDLRDFVRGRGSKVSLIELANEFRTRKELIEPMMQSLVDKGQVETWESTPVSCGCGASCGCGGAASAGKPIRFYRWKQQA
ncbi:FeoC-like transcriptional regulator [Mesosutterella sp. AGMB02718]|uniref:FeoC-like transcriptional regulator n=1 Tax=Mesosutterella faecium TaxID=2925194 RepID=A0ABT7IQU8_9BURK|nr:FeoC-like transcriptional regulator [Mesosutterella sp. AGMB02718]MDL2059657.1 FeoC-like transcriptional regulator [Mesosutterella sp. AGMB02718]